jgi:hypothetical protein
MELTGLLAHILNDSLDAGDDEAQFNGYVGEEVDKCIVNLKEHLEREHRNRHLELLKDFGYPVDVITWYINEGEFSNCNNDNSAFSNP